MTPLRILLLEDSPPDADLILASLSEAGIACREAVRVETREAFRAALDRTGFDLILADYALPAFDGLSALETVRAMGLETPVLFVSGTIGEDLAIEVLKRGATDYVLKERLERLAPSVHRALREAAERADRRLAQAALRASEERTRGLLARERAARAEAEAASRVQDEFLAIVSHELRTPLTPILGWAYLLRHAEVDDDERQHGLEMIERNARLQARIIEDLLDVSRIISGKLELQPARVDLPGVITEAVVAARPDAEAKGIDLEAEIDPDAGSVLGDRVRLRQVADHLLSNAVKFTPAGGRAWVRLEVAGPSVRLVVSDTGAGIRPEFLPHAFDHFRQGDSSCTRAHGGLGLGLAIVRNLVELHGGRVRAESPGEGRGARFTVELPREADERPESGPVDPRRGGLDTVSEAPHIEPEIEEHEASGGRAEPDARSSPEAFELGPTEPGTTLAGLRVLLVEDEDDSRELLAVLLRWCGAEVASVATFEAALEALEHRPPDVLVSDIGLRHRTGYELIREVRAREAQRGGSPLPAVALTAFATPEDRARALESGFQEHLAKPIDPYELAALLARLARPD